MARTLPIVWKTLPLSYIPSLFRFLSFPLSSLHSIPLFFCPFLKQGLTIVPRQASNSDPTPASGFWVAGIIGVCVPLHQVLFETSTEKLVGEIESLEVD